MSECHNYTRLNNADRNITYGTGHHCDNHIGPGWFRFEGSAGTRMPTSCPPENRCGTHMPGWLKGSHPTVADGQVSRTVCFHWKSSCCYWKTDIFVRNCSSYYVYYLSGTPTCYARYCGTDWKQGARKVLHILLFHLSRLHCTKETKKRKKGKIALNFNIWTQEKVEKKNYYAAQSTARVSKQEWDFLKLKMKINILLSRFKDQVRNK